MLHTGDRPIHIIGQGLAGSVLAFRLIEAGYRPLVFDRGHQEASSSVAAGMWNPVNFKRLNVGTQPDVFLSAMHSTYRRMENWLSATFFKPLPIVRLYADQEEVNNWDIQSAMGKVASRYLSDAHYNTIDPRVKTRYGAGLVEEGGRVDLPALLRAMRQRLQGMSLLQESDYTTTDPEALVVHCSGMAIIDHPLWEWLPMAPNKGQVLTIALPDFDQQHIYHFGRFVVPMQDHVYKLGSTYELKPTDRNPDPALATEMLSDLGQAISAEAQVIEHRAGFRPTTFDRMPLVGPHPEFPQHVVFNGFGSRGVYYVPHCAQQLVDLLVLGKSVDREISLERTHKHYRRN